MAILKCKMCGGDMELTADKTFGTCEYCGSTMTLPKADNEQRAAAFNRGNHFRRIGEFDKALAVYERIIRDNETDAEAHWCCALCRFGIEYVEDPTTYEWLPTCHRASFDSFLEDVDYKAALEYSDGITRRQYLKDGAKIAEVQRGILATSQNTEPYDVFICYKESDESGNRTRDSLMAQEIYYQLTEQGRKVFFARITLEDVAGTQYEPYIFAALNSAKVMVVVGTKPEYLNAVWVKNEWSRFLAMMKKDRHKILLPCYRDMDPYDMPDQLSVLQSYDMAKIGFIQDLTRGIAKVLNAEQKPETVKETVVVQQPSAPTKTAPLLKRAFMFLEDGEWDNADEYCEKVLDMEPENAQAYLGKLMAELCVSKVEELKYEEKPFNNKNNYRKIIRFGDNSLKIQLEGYTTYISERNEIERRKQEEANRKQMEELRKQEEKRQKQEEERRKWIKEQKEQLPLIRKKLQKAQYLVFAGDYHTVGLKSDGTVMATGNNRYNQCDVDNWKNVVAVFSGGSHTIGLMPDHTVVAVGKNNNRQCNVSGWKNIVAVSAGMAHTVGLKLDGTVIAVGDNSRGQCEVIDWKDIVSVSAGDSHTVGLKTDGTVVSAGSNDDGQCEVYGWKNIISICAGDNHTVGLKADGTVVAVGDYGNGQCHVSDWEHIVSVSAGGSHSVGLKSDGTVVAVGDNEDGQCNVNTWKNIVAINAGAVHTVGIKNDGTVVAAGWNKDGQCDVNEWKLFENFDNLDAEKERVRVLFEEEKCIKLQRRKAGLCQHCGGELKGFFSKTCVSCGNVKDY